MYLLFVLLVLFCYSCKAESSEENVRFNRQDSLSIEKTFASLHAKKSLSQEQQLAILYFLPDNYCKQCIAGEAESGWLRSGHAILKHIAPIVVSIGTTTSHDSLPLSKKFQIEFVRQTQQLERLFMHAGIIDVATGKLLYIYKIGSTDFAPIYSRVDSLLFSRELHRPRNLRDFPLVTSHTIALSGDNEIRDAECVFHTNGSFQIFSPTKRTGWLFSKNGSLLRSYVIPQSFDAVGRSFILPTTFLFTSDNSGICIYNQISDFVDTVINNELSQFARSNEQHIDSVIWINGKESRSALSSFDKNYPIYSAIAGRQFNSIWYINTAPVMDTVSQKFFYMWVHTDTSIQQLSFPIAYSIFSPRQFSSFGNYLYSINAKGQLWRFSTDGRVLNLPLSYYPQGMRILTSATSDGISIQEQNSSATYIMRYTAIGLRDTPPIIVEPNSFCAFTDQNTVICLYRKQLEGGSIHWYYEEYDVSSIMN